jgi:hypothetical protein
MPVYDMTDYMRTSNARFGKTHHSAVLDGLASVMVHGTFCTAVGSRNAVSDSMCWSYQIG